MSLRFEICQHLRDMPAAAWNGLLSDADTPFVRHEYLVALEESGCVSAATGWTPQHLCLWQGTQLLAACPLYKKDHSYGEYVFDWSWAQAYEQLGQSYYPKLLSAIPFTPVRGSRLLAQTPAAREQLIDHLLKVVQTQGLSSWHVLFGHEHEMSLLEARGMMRREQIQFHWRNAGYSDFEDFTQAMSAKKRKNIRQERRDFQADAFQFKHLSGHEASAEDWAFFYQCYAQNYFRHYSKPYLNLDFFQRLRSSMPDHVHLIIAQHSGQAIAAALLILQAGEQQAFSGPGSRAFGRYWGAMMEVPLLHFEVAYYQSIDFCIRQGIETLEGGAQGEHKLARGFMPVVMSSAHGIAHPQMAQAVDQFLRRERAGIDAYADELFRHSPLKDL
jgi:predicted N-acyltransferase